MTTGQRIAQRRKEQALSQEALGEALGVSRQAIYKWESDATLPEIEKLVALSRMFGVSVGWLLGVEAESTAQVEGGSAGEGGESPELTEAQLHIVEEITARYADTQQKKAPWGKWDVRILFGICGLLVASVLTINSKVTQLSGQYNSLQSSISGLSDSLSGQVGAIGGQVEDALEQKSSLLSDFSAEISGVDIAAGTITFSVRAVPKTRLEGMTALFWADLSGTSTIGSPTLVSDPSAFSAVVTCPLTDKIALFVRFTYPDGTQQTQLLDTYSDLYTAALPQIGAVGEDFLFGLQISSTNQLDLPESYAFLGAVSTAPSTPAIPALKPASTKTLRVGLFRNQKLVAWGEECEQPPALSGVSAGATQFYRFAPQSIAVASQDSLCVAAVVWDEYGRVSVHPSLFYVPEREATGRLALFPSAPLSKPDPNWIY